MSGTTTTAPFPAHRLPRQLTSFVGRQHEQAEVARLLAAGPLVTLTGPGGVGKTRLAVESAAVIGTRYPDGVALVELAALREPALVPQAIAAAVGLGEEAGSSLIDQIIAWFHARRFLLVLDNCEHLVEACARLVDALVRACPHLHVLATSREPLGVAGECIWRVPSLAVPASDAAPPAEQVLASEAGRLFVERARVAQPHFALTARNAGAVAAICARLDGLPLAIELAAARANLLTAEQIAARLDDRFRLLASEDRTAQPRQRTLEALIDWSYDLLDEPEQHLFDRLSVFAGSFTLEAVEGVCAGEDVDAADVLDLLARLLRKSLLALTDPGAEGVMRYRLLESLQQYSWQSLRIRGETERMRRRHLDWCLTLAEQAEPELTGPRQSEWLARLDTEHDNLRAALGWALRPGTEEPEAGLRLAATLWGFWYARGYLSEGRGWLEQALAAAPRTPSAVRARALLGGGVLARSQGDAARAAALLEESLEVWRTLGDARGVAHCLNSLAGVAHQQGDVTRARSLLEESLTAWRAAADRRGLAVALNNLGTIAREEGDLERAALLGEESLALRRELGDAGGIGVALTNLGLVALRRREPERAEELLVEGITLYHRLSDRLGVVSCLEGLAAVAAAWGQAMRAARLLGGAEAVRAALSAPLPEGNRAEYQASIDLARARLRADAFTAAWNEGRALTLDEAVAYAATREAPGSGPAARTARGAAPPLSRRETEVAALVARGLTNREIAEELVLSERTVDTHVMNILAKLGFQSRTQVAVWAADQGLVRGHR